MENAMTRYQTEINKSSFTCLQVGLELCLKLNEADPNSGSIPEAPCKPLLNLEIHRDAHNILRHPVGDLGKGLGGEGNPLGLFFNIFFFNYL